MRIFAAAVLSAWLALPAGAGRPVPPPHPPTRDKGPGPIVYYTQTGPVGTWAGPSHPATRDKGPGFLLPHVVPDPFQGPASRDHPPTRDKGPGA